jgi:hypothetical protein
VTRTVSASAQAPRDPSLKRLDKMALRAIARRRSNVELFTIPLYMTSLYSIQGMHAITGKGNNFYQGPAVARRQDVGQSQIRRRAGVQPGVLGVHPGDAAPADGRQHGHRIGDQSQLHEHGAAESPPRLDLLRPVQEHHSGHHRPEGHHPPRGRGGERRAVVGHVLRLFIAIEQPEADARANIKPDKEKDYFPQAPFADWEPGQPLPLFGTIGWMYQCYYDYLSLEYSDGTTLWDAVFTRLGRAERSVQQLLFARPSDARVHGLRDHDRHHRQVHRLRADGLDDGCDHRPGRGQRDQAPASASAGGQAQVPVLGHRPARRLSQL